LGLSRRYLTIYSWQLTWRFSRTRNGSWGFSHFRIKFARNHGGRIFFNFKYCRGPTYLPYVQDSLQQASQIFCTSYIQASLSHATSHKRSMLPKKHHVEVDAKLLTCHIEVNASSFTTMCNQPSDSMHPRQHEQSHHDTVKSHKVWVTDM